MNRCMDFDRSIDQGLKGPSGRVGVGVIGAGDQAKTCADYPALDLSRPWQPRIMALMRSLSAPSSSGFAPRTGSLLAFDTSTELMSVAVLRGGADDGQVWQHRGPGGAQTSTHLIPSIQALMAQADLEFEQLDAIVFGMGPGSFTGLRTACSVAQGLAFGARVKVLPVNTLLAVAEEARFQGAASLARCQVTALLDARMDQMYAGRYEFQDGQWRQSGEHRLLRPEDLVDEAGDLLAGNVFAAYGTRLPASMALRVDAQPSATALLRLAPGLLAAGAALPAEQALPLYIRDKVAQTSLERAARKVVL